MSRTATRARSPGSYEVGLLIVRARRGLWQACETALDAAGESMLHWQVLAQIERSGVVCQRELSEHIAMDPAGVSRCLDALEKEGLVQRTRDADDRRRVRVELTASGRERHARLLPIVTDAMETMLAPLDPASRRTLAELLGRCLET